MQGLAQRNEGNDAERLFDMDDQRSRLGGSAPSGVQTAVGEGVPSTLR